MFGLMFLTAVAHVAAQAAPSSATGLATFSLAQRCALSTLVAKQVREVVEVTHRTEQLFAGGRLNLLIAADRRGGEPVPLLRAGEACSDITLPMMLGSGKLGVSIAAGPPEALAGPGPYVVVSVRATGDRQWELTWPLDDVRLPCTRQSGVSVCPPGRTSGGPWLPTLRLRVTYRKKFVVKEAVLLLSKQEDDISQGVRAGQP